MTGKAARRGPAIAPAAELEKAALSYLDRFDATAETLRRVLLEKVRRSARAHGTDAEDGRAVIEELIERYTESGLVSDVRYAGTMASGMRQKGSSIRAIRHKLRARGVTEENISKALESENIDPDGEIEAANAFARRRRLGPYRKAEERSARLQRDFAALARAGFSLDVARAVLDHEGSEWEDQ